MGVLAGPAALSAIAVIGADRPEGQFAEHGSGGAVEDDDVVGRGLDDGDLLALPVHADADLALAVVHAALWGHDQHAWAGLAASRPPIAGSDLGQRLVDLGG